MAMKSSPIVAALFFEVDVADGVDDFAAAVAGAVSAGAGAAVVAVDGIVDGLVVVAAVVGPIQLSQL